MAVFKCEMCGGNLDVREGMSVCECPYCGTRQTLPQMSGSKWTDPNARRPFHGDNEFDKSESKPADTEDQAGVDTAALLKRAFLLLEDGEFERADKYCERVLELEPENAEAYLGKLMAQLEVFEREELAWCVDRLDETDAYQKVMRFGGEPVKRELNGYNQQIIQRINEEEEERKKNRQEREQERQKTQGKQKQQRQKREREQREQRQKHERELREQKQKREQELREQNLKQEWEEREQERKLDQEIQEQKRKREQELKRREEIYQSALQILESATESSQLEEAVNQLKTIEKYKNAAELIAVATEKMEQLEQEKRKKRRIFAAVLGTAVIVVFIMCVPIIFTANKRYKNNYKYNYAVETARRRIRFGRYDIAYQELMDALSEGQANEEMRTLLFAAAVERLDADDYEKVKEILDQIPLYTCDDTGDNGQLESLMYQKMQECLEKAEYAKIGILLSIIDDLPENTDLLSDMAARVESILYQEVQKKIEAENYSEMKNLLSAINNLSGISGQTAELIYQTIYQYLEHGEKAKARVLHNQIPILDAYNIPIEYTKINLILAEVGDSVFFSRHNGPYYVLEKKESGEMLLQRVIDTQVKTRYGGTAFSVYAIESDWKDSGIRKWLNTDFLQNFFTEEEQTIIMTSTLQNECFIVEGSNPGGCYLAHEDFWDKRLELEETEDKIFLPLLSDMYREFERSGGVKKLSSLNNDPIKRFQFAQSQFKAAYYRSSGVSDDTQENVKHFETLLSYKGAYLDTHLLLGHEVDENSEHSSLDGHEGEVLKYPNMPIYIRMWVNPYAESFEESTSF